MKVEPLSFIQGKSFIVATWYASPIACIRCDMKYYHAGRQYMTHPNRVGQLRGSIRVLLHPIDNCQVSSMGDLEGRMICTTRVLPIHVCKLSYKSLGNDRSP